MPALTYATRVGLSVGEPERPAHVAVLREPSTAELLRTKGRLYVLVEIAGRGTAAREAALEAAEVLRDEYYYDRSAGIEVSLRRAILQGNKRARLKLRGVDAGLHLACVVLRGNEAYAVRVGAAEIFLVRRARLFVPGVYPGELTDYQYRGGLSPTPPFGSQSDLLVSVWREQIELGDVLLLAGAKLVEALGAEPLKSAAVTLHPSAAARQLREKVRAQDARADEAVIVVEIAPPSAARAPGQLGLAAEESEVEELAERIRERIDAMWRRRPRVGRAVAWFLRLFARPLAAVLAVFLAFLPRHAPPLPRAADVAALQAARRRRVAAVLAVLLVALSSGVLYFAYLDFERAREVAGASLAIGRAERELAAAEAAATKTPADVPAARAKLEQAESALLEAERRPFADHARIARLRESIAKLRERLTNVLADLSTQDPKSAPFAISHTSNAAFVADPGAGKVWRVGLEGEVKVVAERGQEGLSGPKLVAAHGDTVYVLDDKNRFYRIDGEQRRELTVTERPAKDPWGLALFSPSALLYVLDRTTGQVWRYEPSPDGHYKQPAFALLAEPVGPGVGRSLAIDGDIWVVTDDGQLHRLRRQGGATTATKVEGFQLRWSGDPSQISAAQAREGSRFLWLLDPRARRVIKLAKDGREIERIALPAQLPAPNAFTVLEEQNVILTLHGTRLARTDVPR